MVVSGREEEHGDAEDEAPTTMAAAAAADRTADPRRLLAGLMVAEGAIEVIVPLPVPCRAQKMRVSEGLACRFNGL